MPPKAPTYSSWLLAALCLLGGAAGAREDEQQIDVTRNGVTTTLTLPVYTSQGVPYASFADIARQLGGSVEVADARATLQWGGSRAEVGLEDVQVTAAGKTFALAHPVRAYNGDALIAIADLVPFLRASFGMGTPDDPPVASALNPAANEPPALAPISPDAAMREVSLEAVELEETTFESVSSALPETAVQPLGKPSFGDAATFVLAIDAGHGGDDSGAVGPGGLVEKALCLAVASDLRRILKEQYGVATIMTREQDDSKSIQARVNRITGEHANLVVSIHGGVTYTPFATGPALFAHRPARSLSTDPKPGLQVAQSLAAALDGVAGQGAPPVHEASLGLMRHADIPGVMVELGNLMDPEEESRLAGGPYQARLAAALADGINRVLQSAGAGGVSP